MTKLKLMEDLDGKLAFWHGKDRIADRDGVLLWLKDMQITKSDAAEMLGVSVSAINQWLLKDGSRPPSRQARVIMRNELARKRLK